MKKIGSIFLFLIVLMALASTADAQLRKQQDKVSEYSGPIVKEYDREPGNWGNLFNMQMDHSYSMMFGSFGGQYQNINAYTNTMHFFFSEKLSGRLDLSLLHSPFGGSFLNSGNGGLETQFIIRNAELNYELGERSNLRIQFQQLPSYGYGYGMNPWGVNQYNPFRY